jgi:hypothetical protein
MMTSWDFRGTGSRTGGWSPSRDHGSVFAQWCLTNDRGNNWFCPNSAKKHKKSAPVPPDEFVGDRIKTLKTTITGLKSVDNQWTQTLRDKLDPDTVNGNLADDRTFKTNQQWVTPTHGGSKDTAPKGSCYGVLFMLAPFVILSGKQEQYPTVWVCACTKGFRKVYEKKSNNWSTVMDHLANVHGIAGTCCVTYKFFKRSREGLAQDLSQSCHVVRSSSSKCGSETKKVLKAMRTAEEEHVLLT